MGYHVLITVMGPALFSKKLFGLPMRQHRYKKQ